MKCASDVKKNENLKIYKNIKCSEIKLMKNKNILIKRDFV